MTRHIATQIYTALKAAKRVLLIPHQHPDGDALGSLTSVVQFLENTGKEYRAFCVTRISDTLNYLPHVEKISTDPTIWKEFFDLIILFDSGDLRYAGVNQYIDALEETPPIVNFDHHITNEYYGTYNFVIPTASSTAEILYRFFTYNDIVIDNTMATCLLTGLITDTDNFTNAATSANSLAVASDLVSIGAHFNKIKENVYKHTPIKAFKLWGLVFSRLSHHKDLDIVHTYIKQQDLAEHDVTEEDIAGMTNFLNSIHDGKAGMILKELPDGKVKGSFRTTRDDIDVSAYAKLFGGGGHQKAAGFVIDHPIETAIAYVLETVQAFLKGEPPLEMEQAI